MLASQEGKRLLELYDEFCRIDRRKLAAFCDSYISLGCMLLRFTRATRESNWSIHISSTREMLHWVSANNWTNYARYMSSMPSTMSVYWCEIVLLPQTHPYYNALLVDGQFTVQRSANSSFAPVPVDQTIDHTMNRDSKTMGGIVGIRGSVQSWIITARDSANILQTCK